MQNPQLLQRLAEAKRFEEGPPTTADRPPHGNTLVRLQDRVKVGVLDLEPERLRNGDLLAEEFLVSQPIASCAPSNPCGHTRFFRCVLTPSRSSIRATVVSS